MPPAPSRGPARGGASDGEGVSRRAADMARIAGVRPRERRVAAARALAINEAAAARACAQAAAALVRHSARHAPHAPGDAAHSGICATRIIVRLPKMTRAPHLGGGQARGYPQCGGDSDSGSDGSGSRFAGAPGPRQPWRARPGRVVTYDSRPPWPRISATKATRPSGQALQY